MSVTRTGSFDVFLEHRGQLRLLESNYKTTGGEGSIYKANATIIKLYNDPEKMRKDNMQEKIKLLSRLKHKFIVSPEGVVYDDKKKPIGLYMPYSDGEALPKIFTNAFRTRENFGNDEAKKLADRMRETVKAAHDYKALMVDANEFNWLAVILGNEGPEPRIIDVDSWTIGSWKAKVIMPSIKDWHTSGFSALSDWFSWGIVTFQIFAGIHPYKGGLDGYTPLELERRMKDNASVFRKGVRLNQAVRDFNLIPGPLLEWYKAVFEKKERSIPPSPYDTGISVSGYARTLHITTTASGVLIFEKIFDRAEDQAIKVWPSGMCLLKSGNLYDLGRKRTVGKMNLKNGEVVKKNGGWIVAEKENEKFVFKFIKENLDWENLSLMLDAGKIFCSGERIFLVSDHGLTELIYINLGKAILSSGLTWNIMANATMWFDGIGIEDALGSIFVVIPFGEKSLAQIRMRELDGLKVINAKAGKRYAEIVVLDKKGLYVKFGISFDGDYKTYKIMRSEVDSPELNTAMLPKGVTATIEKDGELSIFVPSNGNTSKVADKDITADMQLCNWEDRVLYIKNGAVWRLRMK